MPRAKNNVAAHKRHKKVLDRAKGNYNGRGKLYRTALETVNKGLTYAYRDRRNKKTCFPFTLDCPYICRSQNVRYQLLDIYARTEKSRCQS